MGDPLKNDNPNGNDTGNDGKSVEYYKSKYEQAVSESISRRKENKQLKEELEAARNLNADVFKSAEEMLSGEVAQIPETQRDLIPGKNALEKLTWIRQAKTKGLFSSAAAHNDGTGGTVPASTPTTKEKWQSDLKAARERGDSVSVTKLLQNKPSEVK
ncbi:MAG: hypothetical protein ABIH23_06615 [bacterium]